MELQSLQPLAQQLFADIRALTFDGVGVTRASYGAGENACARHLEAFARAEGLEVTTDRAGNFVYSDPADTRQGPVIWTGSHLDSVPQGGNYDGLAGIVAGLLVLIAAKRQGVTLPAPLQVIGFRGEESAWFGKAYMGSGALWGKLTAADLALQRREDGVTLGDALAACGADLAAIARQDKLFNPADIRAYVELHIEQGPVMVAREIPVGVVSGIRGNVRHNKIECFGEAQHSGVVPRWLRKDAVFAVSDLIVRLDTHWRALLERGTDLVVTCGVVQTNPAEHSISRVPGYAHFSFEARSKSSDTLEAFYQLVQAEMASIERERGVKFQLDRRLLSEPAVTDPQLCDLMAKACRERGIAHERIPSGAGHDAALFANGGVPSAMVFVRNQHGSHNPHEAMELSDFMLGTQVMADTIAAIPVAPASV
ncbi:hydantoinase/carbamoylase family amidase [Comamonas aquatica]|jgi:N-carbamoyl-L-amino-acid hydrolase|uniref:Hydantoinase/carbamoylase family amidase n=1 Tax=Comamonas aquatica TaxID=225991 RepID=A0AA42HUP7_9BURK|nr:hydantoinase/carbamoylase family amidase [Comamonas aquatica]MDH0364631.1 hydantoinase/carbamoylase family amidase [Comamonas aquatica]MDH0383525.1 hydantoinase/carbamoylase family amidase [Comamonas aquatica]MDH0431503.1 hydantoinase/carbamoylase family amidase [Comamonas aquatica]MDH0942604.1 hydantoinase/carbamoylase family amidase [Comamonas aquatica]MDH1766428.1 hydantoinase/carbamoylase family amidase [Comamonas aquatica]